MQTLTELKINEIELPIPKGMLDLSEPTRMLMEQMKKVTQNPSQEIPVAEAQCEIVGRLIDIAKVQLQQGQLVMDIVKINRK
jgi:hypothetical protein